MYSPTSSRSGDARLVDERSVSVRSPPRSRMFAARALRQSSWSRRASARVRGSPWACRQQGWAGGPKEPSASGGGADPQAVVDGAGGHRVDHQIARAVLQVDSCVGVLSQSGVDGTTGLGTGGAPPSTASGCAGRCCSASPCSQCAARPSATGRRVRGRARRSRVRSRAGACPGCRSRSLAGRS